MNMSFPKLTNYQINELIHESDRTLVYRGRKTNDGQPVVIKLMQREYPTFNELVQFRNQYAIASNLNVEGIVKPYALERYEKRYALTMEDFGGMSLGEYYQNSTPTIAEFLSLGIQLSQILHQLHQNRVIHKDLKPANILINPDTQEVKLIDFSISSLLPKETQTLQTPNVLEGTLAYISPEQTGRMNRGIDYRSDFYSLGVTFYQLLNGKLPFETNDALELVHCHIAQIPSTISSQIPTPLRKIVMKLMAKNAEERYQSALGLKYDLEKCLVQWEEKGSIEEFTLGERDLSDRFLIPEKLYGRETEVRTLLDAFERVSGGNSELLLVAGYSGVGKTAVINEAHKPITEKRGYFIKGKFDQFQRNIPFFAFVQAFRDLMRQLLAESDVQLESWKQQIIEAVGENGQVIIEVIPELEAIIGKQPPVPQLEGSAAQNRFNLLFPKFVGVFLSEKHPLTMFIDDLQWADSASLGLLKLLMKSSDGGYLLILGAYRDNEVFPAHPLMLTLEEIQQNNTAIETLTLAPLDELNINLLVADTLLCSTKIAAPLSELVYQKTRGNPFFTTQFLKGLHEDNWIVFDSEARYWQCDLSKVRQLALTDNVVEFMVGRLHKLPEATQDVLKLAACIGAQFDLATLAVVCEESQERVAADLWSALREDFVIPKSQTYKFFQGDESEKIDIEDFTVEYRFLHDRVQQAAYRLIPEEQKPRVHYGIGQVLWQKIPLEKRQERLFDLVNQLNYGIALVRDRETREQLAQLNLDACRMAKSATAYQAGREYVKTGLAFLSETAWQQQYKMCLEFHEIAAELASFCGDFEDMERFLATIVAQTSSLLDRILAYRIKIQANVSQNKLSEAIAIASDVLEQLGVTFPENSTSDDRYRAIAEIDLLLGDRPIGELAELPMMSDGNKLAIIEIASSILTAAFSSGSPLFPFLVALPVKLSIQYGNTPASTISYAYYGNILCNFAKDVNKAAQFGQVAMEIISKLNIKATKSQVLGVLGAFIFHRTLLLADTLEISRDGYTTGLEVGSWEYAGYHAHQFCLHAFWSGRSLIQFAGEIGSYCDGLVQINQLTPTNWSRPYWQLTLNLLARSESPCILSGEALVEDEFLSLVNSNGNVYGLYCFYLCKMMLCYVFGEIASARQQSLAIENYRLTAAGTVGEAEFYFYDSLILLATLLQQGDRCSGELQQSTDWQQVEENLIQLQQYWAAHAPMNHQHKVDLIEAERARLSDNKTAAIELYDRAIKGAKENGYIQEEALANERAALFYLDWGKETVAKVHIEEAYYCYARWGAKAKADQLEAKYPQFLTFQPQTNSGSSSHPSLNTLTSSNSSLDLAAAIKASRAISGEIELNSLLRALIQIVLENAGADKAILILNNSDTWVVSAKCDGGNCELLNVPCDETSNLPHGLFNTVKRTRQTILVNNIEEDDTWLRDPYLVENRPQSLCCLPILERGQLLGILYLENNITAGAFTSDRLEVLNLLTAQAAVSIENARLYRRLEDYTHDLEAQVEARTGELQEKNQELQEALKQLQQTQTQLIHTEKMSALGQMVAGVAHEINNPVNFIAGNIGPTREYVCDLLDLLALYEEKAPSAVIEEKAEDVDLEYLRDDLAKILDSMQSGSDRIAQIVLSLRNFSRLGESKRKQVDLHEGLENTLLILQHRLLGSEEGPEIAIVKNYGKLPPIYCYPSQLNQVFLQILDNAIDALRESQTSSSLEIWIATKMLDAQTARIRIADSGPGMSESVCQKAFDPFFTTKPVGRGTGLGLSVSYQIVVEQHGGGLQCVSELGKGTEFIIDIPLQEV